MIDWKIFEDELINYFNSVDGSRTMADSAKRISILFQQAVMRGETMFGQKVLSINVKPFELAMFSAFSMQYASSVLLGILPYQIMAYGLMASMLTVEIAGTPPIPPSILPLPPKPGFVLIPGNEKLLAPILKFAFADFVQIKTTEMAAKLLALALRLHLSTISGMWLGLMPTPAGLVPAPPIPWVGIF